MADVRSQLRVEERGAIQSAGDNEVIAGRSGNVRLGLLGLLKGAHTPKIA